MYTQEEINQFLIHNNINAKVIYIGEKSIGIELVGVLDFEELDKLHELFTTEQILVVKQEKYKTSEPFCSTFEETITHIYIRNYKLFSLRW